MNALQFKKAAKEIGVKVYSIRKFKNKHTEGYTCIFAHYYNENTIGIEKTKTFCEMEYSEILDNHFSQN